MAYGSLKRNGITAKLLYQVGKWIYNKTNKIVFTVEGGKNYIVDKGWDFKNG